MPLRDVLMIAAVGVGLLSGGCEKPKAKDLRATSQPTTQDALRSFKGWELYTWQEGNAWQLSLLVGTNRNKTDEEIVATVFRLQDIDAAKAKLSTLAQGEFVTLMTRKPGGPQPPKEVQEELRNFCNKHGLQWQ